MSIESEYTAVRNKLTKAQLEIKCLLRAADNLDLCGMSIAQYVEHNRKTLEEAAEAVPYE